MMKIKNIYDTKISKVLSLHTWHSFNKNDVCNMIINVIDEESAGEKEEEKTQNDSKTLIEKLDVDEGLAITLIEQGYRNLESIASASSEDLEAIDGFDIEISELLVNRAKEALLTLTMEISDEEGDANDLMSVEGMDMVLALELSQKGINDKEELAEQSIEELTSIMDISEEDAGDLIMKARAHWFE